VTEPLTWDFWEGFCECLATQNELLSLVVGSLIEVGAPPHLYRDLRHILSFHILVCPHRATPAVIRMLDTAG
jgi:hypothetical protein